MCAGGVDVCGGCVCVLGRRPCFLVSTASSAWSGVQRRERLNWRVADAGNASVIRIAALRSYLRVTAICSIVEGQKLIHFFPSCCDPNLRLSSKHATKFVEILLNE